MTLKNVLVLAAIVLCMPLAAEDIVVLPQGVVKGPSSSSSVPKDSAESGFLTAALADLAQATPFDATFALINPPAWGRVVSPETTGRLQIRRSFTHGFVFHVVMEHLLAHHTYVLCINGRPNYPGNELLPQAVPGNAAEKYFDFYSAETDAAGRYDAGCALFLHPGAYNVHFYVKDVTDHKIILYGLDYFDFEVK